MLDFGWVQIFAVSSVFKNGAFMVYLLPQINVMRYDFKQKWRWRLIFGWGIWMVQINFGGMQ